MQFDYHIDVLRNGVKVGNAKAISAVVKFDRDAEVCRALQADIFADSLKSITDFQSFSDRFRPVLTIDGKSSSLGVYIAVSMPESLSDIGSEIRLEAYDETMILKQAAFTVRKFFPAGDGYLDIINNLLTECGFANVLEVYTDAVLSNDVEFEPGTTYMHAINSLLDGINYEHVHADSEGNIVIHPVMQKTQGDHIYSDLKNKRIVLPIKRTTDIYNLPNVITGIVSLPQMSEPITYTKVNDDTASEISVQKRGYRVVQVLNLNNIADANTLKEYIDQKYLDACQVTEEVELQTAPEGGHEYGDYVQISTELISGLFYERSWQMNFGTGATMTHVLERKVFV